MQHPALTSLHNTAPTDPPPLSSAKPDSIQGRRASETRKDYLHRVLDRVTELGERKPAAKTEAFCNHGNTKQEQPELPPPPPSYDEALALGLFLDEKLGLPDGANEEGTSPAASYTSTRSHDNNSRRSLRRSRPLHHHTAPQDEHRTKLDQPSHQQATRRRSARKGSMVEQAHSLASEESVQAEIERIQRQFADNDEDSNTNMSRSTNRSRDSIYKIPSALEPASQGRKEESESGRSLFRVTKRENLPSMKDAQSRPYVG